jgi:hypothetical protein
MMNDFVNKSAINLIEALFTRLNYEMSQNYKIPIYDRRAAIRILRTTAQINNNKQSIDSFCIPSIVNPVGELYDRC